MELLSWSPDCGLPSWHQRCLAFRAYAKFAGAPVNVRSTNNPFWTENGDLPVFRGANGFVTSDFRVFVEHLAGKGFSTDARLDAKQKAENTAFEQLLQNSLGPALALAFWVDSRNHVEFTRPWFAKKLMFPLGLFYPNRYWKRANALVESVTSVDCALNSEIDVEYALMEKVVLKHAEECLQLLSVRLGTNTFFHGNAPCSLDALVFSYVAPLIKVTLPSTNVTSCANKHTNLVRYVSRILTAYFPDIVASENEESSKEKDKSDEDKSLGSWSNILGSATIAILAMTGYAFSSGLAEALRESGRRAISG